MTNPTCFTASKLRANVYRVLDHVLETGVPVEIEHHGHRLRIVRAAALKRLPRPKCPYG